VGGEYGGIEGTLLQLRLLSFFEGRLLFPFLRCRGRGEKASGGKKKTVAGYQEASLIEGVWGPHLLPNFVRYTDEGPEEEEAASRSHKGLVYHFLDGTSTGGGGRETQ